MSVVLKKWIVWPTWFAHVKHLPIKKKYWMPADSRNPLIYTNKITQQNDLDDPIKKPSVQVLNAKKRKHQ